MKNHKILKIEFRQSGEGVTWPRAGDEHVHMDLYNTISAVYDFNFQQTF